VSEAFLSDPDFTLFVGDALETLREFADESVHCCVTSPPYWGLRDYGTGSWEEGDPDCDHARPATTMNVGFNERWGQGAGQRKQERKSDGQYAVICEKCGARRVDQQLGLEPTPGEYVEKMVAIFREVRRVLRADGTCWLNLGDSYVSTAGSIRTIAEGGKSYEALNEDGADGRLLNSERQRSGAR
jgi:site-specific DNA-methyltransferase (cytosine-N4-specific)